jgi:hypothetical protein
VLKCERRTHDVEGVEERFGHYRRPPLVAAVIGFAFGAASIGCVDLTLPIADGGAPFVSNGPEAGNKLDAARDPNPSGSGGNSGSGGKSGAGGSTSASTLGNGLVAHWALDEKQGSRLEDETALAGPGWALEGAAWLTANLPAPLGSGNHSALRFGGVNAFATLGVQGVPDNRSPRTIALWFNLDASATLTQDFISLTDGVGAAVNLSARNGLLVAAGWGGPVLVSVTAPATGSWHHLTYSYDGRANRLYLDGMLMSQGTALPQQGSVREGWLASSRGRTDFLAGALDDVRIYDRALTDAEVAALAGGGSGTLGPRNAVTEPPLRNLVGYWRLDESAPNVPFADSSGNAIYAKGLHTPLPVGGAPGVAFSNPHGLSFNGGQCAVIGNPSVLNFSGVITLSAWVNLSSRSGTRSIVLHGPAGTETGLQLDANAYVIYSASNGGVHRATFAIPSDDVGAWVHLVGTYDGAAWRLYRNGNQIGVTVDTVGALVGSGNWAIGSEGGCTDRFFRGSIDDVRIYHGPLGAHEVARLAAGNQ